MARGFIYEIATTPEDLFCIGEEDFYDKLDALSIDYVEDADDPEEQAKDFIHWLEKTGECMRGKDVTDLHVERVIVERVIKSFIISKDFKTRYFADRFEEFKRLVKDMAIEDFAETDPYHIRFLLHDTIGDGVWYSGSFYTLDMFIREYMEPGTRYYIGSVLLMH